MLGWQIFVHSVRMVFRNLQEALQIGLVLSVFTAVISTVLMQASGMADDFTADDVTSLSTGDVVLLIAAILIGFVVTLWIFVAWHRFILLEDYPKGWIPTLRIDRLRDYIGYTFALLAICLGAGIFCGILIGLLTPIVSAVLPFSTLLIMVLPLLIFTFAYMVFLRLGCVLPAAAINAPLGLREAKQATEGKNGAIFVLAIILGTFQFLLNALIFQASLILPFAGIAGQTIIGLVLSLVNVSVLTTMYGVFIEKRELA
ncbi:hypothetical protein [Ruegeria arenilitoris]|uniref:hypothetical protein n=1 Tax=Ruegeria arenilitoris TaxID=1173585 RepID=UPI00147B7F25|nr:hypothetical protein [Ruegeria arenilitoris]